MDTTPRTCPICRESHEPRALSYDGAGINSCGMYRSRIATFTERRGDIAQQLGQIFAAGPELLATLRRLAGWAQHAAKPYLDANPRDVTLQSALDVIARATPKPSTGVES